MNLHDTRRCEALNAALHLLERVSQTLLLKAEESVDLNQPADPRVATAAGKVEAALADYKEARFGSHRVGNYDMASAILCHQYRDDAKHGGHYIPDHNVDFYGNLAGRTILAAATIIETAPE